MSEKHGHLRAVQAYTVVRNTTDICNQANSYSYTSEQRERVKHGHLRAVQAYTVVYAMLRICNQLATLTSEQRERETHGHLRAVQAYTVVCNTTDMQSSNQLLLYE